MVTLESSEFSEIRQEIEQFVEWIFMHSTNKIVRSDKVIHDTVWGTNSFTRAEIALINSPLIQRLRQIHQTASGFLTYPSTRHSRFEHTLGVTVNVNSLYSALEEKYTKNSKDKKIDLLSNREDLRFAALLHDCGHGPFSHTSEEVYGKYAIINKLKTIKELKGAKPHEILAYLIIHSKKFTEYLSFVEKEYGLTLDKDLISDSIVGHVRNSTEHYKIDFINGPFDADKLDYLFRDGLFSGLPLNVDLDRLWYSLGLNKVDGRNRLTVDWGGVNTLEQITFAKMMLYPAIYHHHKVRVSDCMFKGIIELIKSKGLTFHRAINGRKLQLDFKSPVHFLYFTDYDFFNQNIIETDVELHQLMHNFMYRRLLKKAIVISQDSVTDEAKLDDFKKFSECGEYNGFDDPYRYLAFLIWERAKCGCLKQEIWVDCPADASFHSVNDTWISPLASGQNAERFTNFFQAERYADQYKHKKWRGHVFCPSECAEDVAKAAVDVFESELGMKFKPLAFQLCNLNSISEEFV